MEQGCPLGEEPTRRSAALVLAGIVAAMWLIRTPLCYRQIGGQDEDYYAVPGWTILETGVPQIPYVPSRDPAGVFYKADEILYALPPAYFYWQAAVYLVTGPGYGAGRVASLLAGSMALVIVYGLATAWLGSRRAGLWSAGVYSLARVFFFPATFARPDMLCCAFGLAALWFVSRDDEPSVPVCSASGILGGLALLTHPFGVLACLQLALVVLVGRGSVGRRLIRLLLVTVAAALAFALWVPLILVDPEVFRIQFGNNVWGRASRGLLSHLIDPRDAIATQWRLLVEHATMLQTVTLGGGVVGFAARHFGRGVKAEPGDRATGSSAPQAGLLLLLSMTSVIGLVVLQGTHPAKGYWCYPGALACVCLGGLLADGERAVSRRWLWLLRLVPLAVLLPGSGIRAVAAHAVHWGNPDYDARAVARSMLDALPAEASYVVDVGFVLDFYLAGREPVLALNIDPYWRIEGADYDYLIVSPTGIEQELPRVLAGERVATFGRRGPFTAYAEVYRPRRVEVTRLRLPDRREGADRTPIQAGRHSDLPFGPSGPHP